MIYQNVYNHKNNTFAQRKSIIKYIKYFRQSLAFDKKMYQIVISYMS